MTRRRLWVATTVCCGLLALPTLGHLTALLTSRVSWSAALAGARSGATSGIEQLQAIATWSRQTVTSAFSTTSAHPVQHAQLMPAPTAAPNGAAASPAGASRVVSRLVDRWHTSADTALVLAALILALMALAVLVTDRVRQRRRSGAPQRARRLAERGAAVGMIARRTGLPQDAVRQLLHPHVESDRAAFADLLAASIDPTPSIGSRSDR